MIERHFTADYINEVCNHPDVFDHVRHKDTKRVDLTRVVENQRNYVLMAEGGGVIFKCVAPTVYDGHLQFLPGYRGTYALRTLREAARWMFENTDAMTLVGKTPHDNPAALRMNTLVPMKFVKVHPHAWEMKGGWVDLHEYVLTRNDWLVSQGIDNAR